MRRYFRVTALTSVTFSGSTCNTGKSGALRARPAWEQWYQAKLAEIVRVVESDEIGAFLLKDIRWLGIVVMVVGLRWWLWVRTTTSPFVLFLSSSDAMSVEQHHRLKLNISPLRVVSLLDVGSNTDSDTAGSLTLDCLRTEDDDDWWKVIVLLIEIAPIVVISADAESPGVIREASHLVSEDITFKTIFLTNRDAPLLRQIPGEIAAEGGHCVASSHGLYRILACALNQGLKPSRERPVSSFR